MTFDSNPLSAADSTVASATQPAKPVAAAISGSSATDAVPKSPALQRAIDQAYKRVFDEPIEDDLNDADALPPGYEPTLFLDDADLDYDTRLALLLQAQESFGTTADLGLIQDMIVADLVTDREQQQVDNDKDLAQTLQRKYQEHIDNTALTEAAILNLVLQETAAAADASESKRSVLPDATDDVDLPLILPASPSSCSVCEDQIWVGGYLPPGADHSTLAALFPECEHEYCTLCLAQWIHTTVTDRNYKFPTICAARDCQVSLNADTFHDLVADLDLDDETQSRFVVRYLEFEGKAVYCPQRRCGALVTVDKPEHFDADGNKDIEASVSCPECKEIMCFRCRSASHHPLKCPDFQKIPIEDRHPEDLAVLQTGRQMRWKHCPRCQALVERRTGCNFMTCLCGQGFCYRCGSGYRSLAPTPRNSHGDPTCECHLFDVPPEVGGFNQPVLDDPLNIRPDVLAGQLVDFQDILEQAAAMLPATLHTRVARYLNESGWPRDSDGRRLAAHGTHELFQTKSIGKPLPGWLAMSYRGLWCHHCYGRFGSFEDLAKHMFETEDHDVFICCNRTFNNQRGFEQHCKQKHNDAPEHFDMWGE